MFGDGEVWRRLMGEKWIYALGILVFWVVLGYAIRTSVFHRLRRWAARTSTDIDDLFLSVLQPHVPLWFLSAGAVLAARIAPIPLAWHAHVDRAALILLFVSGSLIVASLLSGLLHLYAARWDLPVPTTSLTSNLLRLAILALGALLLLTNLGISITPLLTALGVGSLAVALALQDTLSNLFAGFYMLINKQIRVSDYIKLDSGQEGYVDDIGWRATRIRELPGNMIMVPNAKLSQAIVTNYYSPNKELAVLIQVGVSYASDLDQVERVTIEVAREVMMHVDGGIPTFEPFIRCHSFGDSSVNFTVILRGREFVDQYLLRHEFVKRLHKRYVQEGIEIPFPQRVITVKEVSTAQDLTFRESVTRL